MEQLYLEVYKELISYPEELGRNIIETTMKFLLCAQKTMQTSDFLWTIAFKLGVPSEDITKDVILDLCRNLVVQDEGLDTLRFAHLSVREFLEKRPEFSESSCNIVAAESCLLRIIASVDRLDAGSAFNVARFAAIQCNRGLMRQLAASNFLEYANQFWVYHCKVAGYTARSDQSGFGKVFQLFVFGESWQSPPFDTWVQCYCSRIPWNIFQETVDDLLDIQSFLCSHSTPTLNQFWIAAVHGFVEVIEAYLQNGRVDKVEKSEALLLAVTYSQPEIIDILMGAIAHVEVTPSLVHHTFRNLSTKRLARLLTNSANIDPDLVLQYDLSGIDEEKVAFVMAKYPNFTVTEDILDFAIHHSSAGFYKEFLARFTDRDTRDKGLLSAVSRYCKEPTEKIKLLLSSGARLTPVVIERAA